MPVIKKCEKCNATASEGIYLFKFPSNSNVRSAWIRFVNNDFVPKSYSTLCSKHFDENDVIKHNVRVKLRPGADIFSQQFLFQKLSVKVLGIIVEQFSSLFNSLCHRRDKVKQIAHLYFALKLKHLCKLRNNKANTLCRHKSKKLVLFKHE